MGKSEPDLPLWLRVSAISLLVLTLVGNVVSDIFVKDYDGLPTTLMLGGLVGAALGIDRAIRRGGSD